jgi:hypothetical protein
LLSVKRGGRTDRWLGRFDILWRRRRAVLASAGNHWSKADMSVTLNPPLPPSAPAEAVAAELLKLGAILASDPETYLERLGQLRSEREAIAQARAASRQEIDEREKSQVEEGKRQTKLAAERSQRLDRREAEVQGRESEVRQGEQALKVAVAKHEAERQQFAAERAAHALKIAKLREFAAE